MRELAIKQETWPVRGVFRISRGSRTEIGLIVVEIREGGVVGHGEGMPSVRYRENVATAAAEVEAIREGLEAGMTREELQTALPPGAARNAVDAALWDLEAKRTGVPVWQLAGLGGAPAPVVTAVTISVDTPEAMAEAAKGWLDAPLLKVKLGGDGDLERVAAVRRAAPGARLIVDANEGWTVGQCREFLPRMAEFGVELVEQPLPAGEDEALRERDRSVPVCADESCHTREDLARLVGLYDFVNIKLDKAGGLTAALLLLREARTTGFEIMIGGMVATSLGMAPAILLTPDVGFVDLDGPLLLAKDREFGLRYENGQVHAPVPELWG